MKRPIIAFSAFTLMLLATPAGADTIGPAKPIDGETLEVAGKRFCLRGIDAPELGQTCRNGDGKSYDCGRISTTALMDLTAGTPVRCLPTGKTEGGCALATCYADGYDLSEGMTYTGWAMADPKTGSAYKSFEQGAKDNSRGLWKGRFARPWDWRARVRTY